LMDFHRNTHHDSSVNKQPTNLLWEGLNNLVAQGLFILFVSWVVRNMNMWIVVLWAFLYSTAHNINYEVLMKSKTHGIHHNRLYVNYGIDIYDIIFNTKYDYNDIENYNHYSINLIIVTAIMYGIINYMSPSSCPSK
jgi:hypothetical protein